MKKFKIGAVLLCTAMLMTACGGKEQSATYQMVSEQNGITMTDSMTLNAKGDTIQSIEETIEMDMSSFDDDTYAQMTEYYEQMIGMYQAVEGVECTGSDSNKVYTISVTIDATGDAISELASQGLMQIEGDSSGKMSFKGSGEALEGSGFEKVE